MPEKDQTPKASSFSPLVIFLFVAVLLGAIIWGAYFYTNGEKTTPNSPKAIKTQEKFPSNEIFRWKIGRELTQDEEELKQSLKKGNYSSSIEEMTDENIIEITDSRLEGGWAYLEAKLYYRETNSLTMGGVFLLAKKENDTWNTLTVADEEFCQYLEETPETLISSTNKALFLNCYQEVTP